jgi:hypothetical protein
MKESELREMYGEDWMNDDQWECWLFMGQLKGFNHLFGKVNTAGDNGIYFIDQNPRDYSTYDYSDLTWLVIAAHEKSIRVEIVPSSPGKMGFVISKRKREGEVCERHPTIEEALEKFRSQKPRYEIDG